MSLLRAPPSREGAAGRLVIVLGAGFLRGAVFVLRVVLLVQQPRVELLPARLHPGHLLVDGRLRAGRGPPARRTLTETQGEEEERQITE